MDLLKRPTVGYRDVVELAQIDSPLEDEQAIRQLEIQARYSGYIDRQQTEIDRQRRSEEVALPGDVDYGAVRGLSSEARQKLSEIRPRTIGQASRIPGITPAAVSLLLVHLRKSRHAA